MNSELAVRLEVTFHRLEVVPAVDLDQKKKKAENQQVLGNQTQIDTVNKLLSRNQAHGFRHQRYVSNKRLLFLANLSKKFFSHRTFQIELVLVFHLLKQPCHHQHDLPVPEN